MLTTKLRRQIEWNFRNYDANRKLGAEEVAYIAERGLCAPYDSIFSGNRGGQSRPTEKAALELSERLKCYHWAKVVENTITAFRFRAEYDIIIGRYFENMKYYPLIDETCSGNESVYTYRINNILNTALMWAREFELVQ